MIGRARAVEDYKKAIDAKKIGDKVLDEAERRQDALIDYISELNHREEKSPSEKQRERADGVARG